jgi:VWFA-related protein
MKPTLLSLSAIVLAAAALCPAMDAQQAGAATSAAGSQASSAKATEQQVMLPVTVHDKKGGLVTNLQKTDLTLIQDGRPQTILSLTHDSAEPFRIGLLVDTSRTVLGAIEAERKAAGSFLDQMMPADGGKEEAFLLHFDREVELVEDFTGSREKLHGDLEDMGPTSHQRDDSQGPETTGDDRPHETGSARNDQLYDAIYLSADELMKNKDGRKILVVFSDGADHGSKETMNDALDAADHAGLSVYTIFFKGEKEASYDKDGLGGNHHGGISYPGSGGGNPGGYPGSGGGGGHKQPEPTSATGLDGKKIMQEIADRTGGHAYEARHTSDLEPIYKLIGDELRGQYLLTYTPDKPDGEGGFHKIALTANNKDWTVATRTGYYASEGKGKE